MSRFLVDCVCSPLERAKSLAAIHCLLFFTGVIGLIRLERNVLLAGERLDSRLATYGSALNVSDSVF